MAYIRTPEIVMAPIKKTQKKKGKRKGENGKRGKRRKRKGDAGGIRGVGRELSVASTRSDAHEKRGE